METTSKDRASLHGQRKRRAVRRKKRGRHLSMATPRRSRASACRRPSRASCSAPSPPLRRARPAVRASQGPWGLLFRGGRLSSGAPPPDLSREGGNEHSTAKPGGVHSEEFAACGVTFEFSRFFQIVDLRLITYNCLYGDQPNRELGRFWRYLHGLEICHRDLKPDNVLVSHSGALDVRLIDFNVAAHGPRGSSPDYESDGGPRLSRRYVPCCERC